MTAPLRVALAQIHSAWADTRGNLERMAGWAEQARDEGAQLVAFPELCVPGICKDERLTSVTETLDGPSVASVRALSRRLGLAIGFGFSEKAEGKPYNAYAVVEPDGTLAGVYRKNHIPVLEAPFWQGHSARPVFTAVGRRVAVATCWDNKYPELLAHYAREGADVGPAPRVPRVPRAELRRRPERPGRRRNTRRRRAARARDPVLTPEGRHP